MVVMTDASQDLRLSQPQVSIGNVGPAIWVGLTANGEPAGTLSVARVRGAAPFTDAELDVVQLFANHASVVLEVERGRDDVRRIAVLQDQERIARDLHDTVIQRLFATGLSLQALARLTTEPATSKVMGAVDDLDETIRQIRTVIFGLDRPATTAAHGVRAHVVDVCAEAARALGFDPTVRFDGPVDAQVPADAADDIVAVVREGLANVARHAGARSVSVEVAADNGRATVTIVDDGCGLQPEVHGVGHGLNNLRRRAEQRGGTFRTSSGASGGTELSWSIPVRAGA
jgi:signal transduction histidine kinase